MSKAFDSRLSLKQGTGNGNGNGNGNGERGTGNGESLKGTSTLTTE